MISANLEIKQIKGYSVEAFLSEIINQIFELDNKTWPKSSALQNCSSAFIAWRIHVYLIFRTNNKTHNNLISKLTYINVLNNM